MKVKDVMSHDVEVVNPEETIQDAAAAMERIDAGVLPVGENDRLVGMITDRDIAVRAVAKGHAPDTKVREIMTKDVKYCFEDDDVDEVCGNMSDIQVRRMPVLNNDKRLVGIISLGDIARREEPEHAGHALQGIAQPGGRHTQSRH
jgi:CBS domain-containing protein